jgi:phage shock protein PspC (stress-responsive transcriptional regulator)
MTDQTQTFATPPGPPPGGRGPAPTLHRSRSDRKLAGVCGGLAAYLGIDPIILRILVVVLALFGGSGLLLYAAAWLLLPDEGQSRSELQKLLDRDGNRPAAFTIVVTVLVIIGVLLAFSSVFDRHRFPGTGPDIWPLVAVGGIAALVWYNRRHPRPPVAPPYTYSQPAQYGQPGQYSQPAQYGTPQAASYSPPSSYPFTPPAPAYPFTPPAPYVVTKPPRHRSVLGALTLSVAAIAAGVMLPFDLSGHWHVPAAAFLAVLLAIVGLGLVVGAFVGRSRGLIAWGILLSLVTAVAGAIPANDVRGTGDVTWRPTAVSAFPADGYHWGAGNATLDLTGLPAQTGTVEVRGKLGAGTLVVLVPDNVRLVIDAHVGLGNIRLPDGNENDGIGRRTGLVIEPSLTPGATLGGTLNLRLDVGAGTLEVRRAQA